MKILLDAFRKTVTGSSRNIFFLFFSFFVFSIVPAYSRKDSLLQVIRSSSDPFHKADACMLLIQEVYTENPDTAFVICESTLELCEKINYPQGMSQCYGWLSYLSKQKGQIIEAIEWLEKGIKEMERDTARADLASAYSNLGSIYYDLGNYDDAANYFHESERLRLEISDEEGLSNSYYNLGNVYLKNKDYDNAIDYYDKSLVILEKINFIPGIGYVELSRGSVYYSRGDYENSLGSQEKALEILTMIGDKRGQSQCLLNIGKNYFTLGKTKQAFESANQSYLIAQEIGQVSVIRDASLLLKDIYKNRLDFRNAYLMLENYHRMNDSLSNEENQKAAIRSNYKVAYEKQAIADSISFVREKEIENIKHEARLNSEKNQRYILYGGIAFLSAIGFLIFKGYRQKKKDNLIILEQKKHVEEQKEMIEEKQKEILDSITYAKRIQTAMLPPDHLFPEYLSESFVLYKPKDIVAGDFYWMDIIKNMGGNVSKILFAAADCTGHGVPGAMVSVICNGALNRSVREYGITDPGKILDKTREIVIQEFERSADEVKDGMDISLCMLEPETKTLYWSGANNPLWIIRNNELIEYKADKQPIGKYPGMQPFITHKISVEKNDLIYIFTDGYADQFGGPKKKKLKYSSFQKILLENIHLSMEKQKDILNNSFENWKGDLEQIDDVCVVGTRIVG